MKMTKIAAIVAASALLVLGTALTSFAAGWTQVDGEWMYLDKDGEAVTECFKPSGSEMYWLNEDGVMATDLLVEYNDNKYYVDETGKMVRNQWVELENVDGEDLFGDTIWYYFQASGKAIKAANTAAKKTINGKKYVFDDEGHMLWGWIANGEMVDDSENNAFLTGVAYCGTADDGVLRTNRWEQLYIVEDTDDKNAWFYFDGTGAKVKADWSDEDNGFTKVKTIGGKKYAFDINGVMQSEWTITTASSAFAPELWPQATASVASYGYFNDPENGAKVCNGWFQVVPQEYVDNGTWSDDAVKWFYADGKGNLLKSTVKTIKGKVYGFNEVGEMVSGVQACGKVNGVWEFAALDDADKLDVWTTIDGSDGYKHVETAGDTVMTSGVRFFSDDEDNDGSMKTGSVKVNVDGDDYAFKFASKGVNKGYGVCGLDGNYYYVNGRKFTADGDVKVQAFACATTGTTKKKVVEVVSGKALAQKAYTATALANELTDPAYAGADNWVVFTSTGAVVKSGTKTDADGYKYWVSNGVLTKVTVD